MEFTDEEKVALKDQFKVWIQLDDLIRKEKMTLKELKKRQAVLTNSIKETMAERNVESLRITVDGVPVLYKKSESKCPITLKEVREKLTELASAEALPELPGLPKMLFEGERPVKERIVLRRSQPKRLTELRI